MTVLVAVRRLTESAAREAREACKALALDPVDWTQGVPRVAPRAVIGGLALGERRIADELITLLEASPATRLVLCAQEPLVKARVTIGDGRVSVLAPPIERAQLVAALRAVIELPPPAIEARADRRFEVLRRTYWVAWTRGANGPAIALDEEHGAVVAIGGSARDRQASAAAMAEPRGDLERQAALGQFPCGVVQLTPDASEWVLYWPADRGALWLCSPNRLPVRWDAARAIAAIGTRRLLRLRAFPADQLVAAWSEARSEVDLLAPLERTVSEGGAATIVGLDAMIRRELHASGLVLEVR